MPGHKPMKDWNSPFFSLLGNMSGDLKIKLFLIYLLVPQKSLENIVWINAFQHNILGHWGSIYGVS